MTIWQIAAGSHQREYSDEFLSRGMAFLGGASRIKRLGQVRPGDLLVLKQGLKKVVAIGRVVERDGRHYGCGDKHWLRDFDGWDLQAYVYVEWRRPKEPLPDLGLKMGAFSRIKGAGTEIVVRAAFEQGESVQITTPEPGPTRPVDDAQILAALAARGMTDEQAQRVKAAFARIRELARYYREECNSNDVREHEARTFLVVPLLLALGWTERQIKIELGAGRGRIDIACFGRPYTRLGRKTNDQDCELIIETKGLKQGLSLAPAQVRGYAEFYPSTRAIVVTNGYCYKVYVKQDGEFPELPTCYLNLLDPRDRYPLDPVHTAGCVEVLTELLPS